MVLDEEMGKVSRRLRVTFTVSSVLFIGVLAVSPVKDSLREWRRYKRDYVSFAQARPESKRLLADVLPGVDQIWIPEMNVVDRCVTCHQGITQASLRNASIRQPFRAHPPLPHSATAWGCSVCHGGQGAATEVAEAHETTLAWEEPILPNRYIQASCGTCHRAAMPETPVLNRGRQLLVRLNCGGCHQLQDIEVPAMRGPDLTNIGTKVSRPWIYKWLKDPRTVTDKDGNVKADGYLTGDEPRMPKFRLADDEIGALSAFLISQRSHPVEPHQFDPKVTAAMEKRPDLDQAAETRFREMFCTTCHSLSVTRGGETQLIGGNIGPELTKVGSKVNPEWLVAWLSEPRGYLAHTSMPRYGWSDQDLYLIRYYLTSTLTDSDLLTGVPQLGEPTPDEIKRGRQLFTDKGCAGCHIIQGISPAKDFGPDQSALGAKNVSQLEFGDSKIPRNLISYIRAKISDPLSVNKGARMPQYALPPDDLIAVTTALLSMKGTPSSPAMEKLVSAPARPEFRPAGEFGELFQRFQCAQCHRFNGYGGTLAPDLSFEGSRAQRTWLLQFLKNPQTLRTTLTYRMPQFNITDKEAAILADYIGLALQSSSVRPPSTGEERFTAEEASMGKQLYDVKYQCQNCHTIGSTGGYVGPSLNNAGNWMNAAWIEQWLRDPQSLVPGAVEPKRSLTEDEVKSLTAYLVTLRQTSGSKTAGGGGK